MSQSPPEPVRPIRALLRGLQALAVLQANDGLSVSEIARRARLPRTTTYRILETLRSGGFVGRDAAERYVLDPKGAAIAAGLRPAPAANGAAEHRA